MVKIMHAVDRSYCPFVADASYLRPRKEVNAATCIALPHLNSCPWSILYSLMNQQPIKLHDLPDRKGLDETSSPNLSTPTKEQSSQRWNKRVIFIGILVFLALSWILSRTSAVTTRHLDIPSDSEDSHGDMGDKRSVGYFVSGQHTLALRLLIKIGQLVSVISWKCSGLACGRGSIDINISLLIGVSMDESSLPNRYRPSTLRTSIMPSPT